jgi:hypothetical protein
MFAKINNLITKKTFLSLLLCVIVFLAPVSLGLSTGTGSAPQPEVISNVVAAQAAAAVTPAVTGNDPTGGTVKKSGGSTIDRIGDGVMKTVGNWIGTIIVAIPSAFLWVGGMLLDNSLNNFVFGMGDYVNSSTKMKDAINNAWTLIRDISNLAFIFGFVYIGIRTIIDPDSASTKRFLSKIIIGALLINFSLFFVKFIVDFANFTAYQIYTAMINGSGTLSATVADRLGIITFFSSPGNPDAFAKMTDGTTGLWFFVLASVLLFIVAFVFIAAALLLITRFVGIVLIMVGSPILFAATIFPQTEHYAGEMWKKLISYAFFAPVFLLLLLISLTLIGGIGGVPSGNGFAETLSKPPSAGQGQATFLGVTLNFIVIIFFFIQSLLIAQKMGVAGGDAAVSIGNKLRAQGQRYLGNTAGNVTFGAVGGLGRATVGRKAHEWSESDDLKDAASRRGFGGVVARQKLKLSRKVGDASFDARNINGLGNAIGAGEGRKGGYKTVLGEIEKKEKEFATSLGEVGDDDVQVEARKKEWENAQRTQKAESVRLREDMKSKTTPEERAVVQAKIDDLEKKEKDAHNNYEKEKQRRIIGSTYTQYDSEDDKGRLDDYRKDVERQEKNIKMMWGEYAKDMPSKTPEEKEAFQKSLRESLKGMKKKLDDTKKEQKKLLTKQPDRGYAGVLENSKIYTAWPIGRLVEHEQEAGKAIRKSAEKGLPKKKDD